MIHCNNLHSVFWIQYFWGGGVQNNTDCTFHLFIAAKKPCKPVIKSQLSVLNSQIHFVVMEKL